MSDNARSPPICGCCSGTTLRPLYKQVRDPQTGENFAIDLCATCTVAQTWPQPADLGPYYGEQYHGGRHGVTEQLCMARRLGFVGKVSAPGRLLDFGCGDGGFLAAACAAGWDAIGVEMKPEDARAKGQAVVESVEQVTGQFDAITLWHALEHLRSPGETLDDLRPLLRPGGHLLIAVPNLASWQAKLFGPNWFHIDVPRHLFHFSPLSLSRLLRGRGFAVVERWGLEAEIDLFGWTQSALNLVLPHPNVLFDTLTRRRRPHSVVEIGTSLLLGSLIAALSAPILPFAAMAGGGGIMVVAARRMG